MSQRKLFRFHWDCGRMGDVEGIFVDTQENVDKAIGEDVYFGEILGKHSEVYGTLDEEDVEVLTDDEDFIAKAIEFGVIPTGYDPLEYINDEEEDEDDD